MNSLKALHVLLGLYAELLLEAGGEIAGITESHLISKVTDTQFGVFLSHAASLLQADVADKTRDIEPCDGAEFVVDGR